MPYTLVRDILFGYTVSLTEGTRFNLQRAITDRLDTHYSSLPLPTYIGQLIRAASGEGARRAITPTISVRPHEYVHALQLRCGFGAFVKQDECTCGAALHHEPAFRNGHLLTCAHNVGFNKTLRHHGITMAIKSVLSEFHVWSVAEPTYLSNALRPDLHVAGRRNCIIDVTVVDSVLALNDRALEVAAEKKHAKYDKLAESHDMLFFPVVVDTYGTLHADAIRFIKRVAGEIEPALRGALVTKMKVAVQMALLRGNARIVDEAMTRLRQKVGFWRL
jgi:hypothetical protein